MNSCCEATDSRKRNNREEDQSSLGLPGRERRADSVALAERTCVGASTGLRSLSLSGILGDVAEGVRDEKST
jgi:hypothetical protein